MRIGLVRHYKVKHEFPTHGILSPQELKAWFEAYDASDVELETTELRGMVWARCYASSMERAVKSARHLFAGPIEVTERLREVPYPDFGKISQRRLPFLLWAVLVRLCWYAAPRVYPESRADVRRRAASMLDDILAGDEENVLIVSHAALMMELRRELLRRGYSGPRFGTAANGKLYVFEPGGA
ncbi:Histidine phosphatase superfamily (branch 1) [Paenibacillus sp. UNCCL117]|uniref:histidine phosphatase family protein n=1 Tax=unclassified Paenibacillus TaxID=185978 RepID=UPI00088DE581|nr:MULTISPECIES: histidine phosphatase family protein [unclassified Paenibacillus]SDE29421.1 Histidine phosphatase superfamily (branch 1) [Paenibacillus sp. cl123]SFW63278.1 Histidine phosphatase superfamily (branch 1) [Paenibacillus sp. UNCCL117]